MKKIVFFDLDGTLTDSREGIEKSIIFGLENRGHAVPDTDTIRLFLGPPIVDSLQQLCGLSPEEATATYKEFQKRYSTVGKFENKVYDGIPELLAKLQAQHYRIVLATAKSEVFAKEILDHFELTPYFELIVGSDYSVGRIHKQEVLQHAINLLDTPLVDNEGRRIAYMVGDRKYDIESGNNLGCTTIGVTYGYGTEAELKEANAEYLCDEPEEIGMTLDLEEMMIRR